MGEVEGAVTRMSGLVGGWPGELCVTEGVVTRAGDLVG